MNYKIRNKQTNKQKAFILPAYALVPFHTILSSGRQKCGGIFSTNLIVAFMINLLHDLIFIGWKNMTFKTSQVLAPVSPSTNSSLIHYNSAMMNYFLLPECSYSPSGLRCVIKVTSHLMLIVSCVLYLAFYSSLSLIGLFLLRF